MLCKGCGAEVTSGQLICPNCGTKNIPPLPPTPPGSMYGPESGKKKSKVLIVIVIGVVALIFMIVAIIIITKVVRLLKTTNDIQNEITDTYVDDTYMDPNIEDTTGDTDSTNSSGEDVITEDTSDDSYHIAYSYKEIPDLLSIDSDSRFSYYDKTVGEDYVTYTFLYSYADATEEDFNTSISDYCDLLTSLNGYYYEEEFGTNQYEETGKKIDYYSKDNTAIGVTAGIEDTGWFAYIDIYDLTDSTVNSAVGDGTVDDSIIENNTDAGSVEDHNGQSDNYNYSYYIAGRDSQYFDLNTEVVMDNGIAFYLYDAIVTDLGDGTAQIDCNMDLAAVKPDTYLYTDDFLIMPTDSSGNGIGDASLVEYVVDRNGEYITAPYLLDTENYDKYTLSFIVPAAATSFSVFGTNVSEGYAVGPVYYANLEVTR